MRVSRRKMTIRGVMGLVAASAVVFWLFRSLESPHEAARRAQCVSNLKQIGLAVHNYVAANEELPVGTMSSAKLAPAKRLGWLFSLFAFLEQWQCLMQLDRDEPYDSPTNIDPIVECSDMDSGKVTRRKASVLRIACYECPSHLRQPAPGEIPRSQYVGITGLGPDSASLPTSNSRAGVFGYDRHVKFADIRDGLSQTMMVAETSVTTGPWTSAAATLRAVDPARRPYFGPGRDFGGNHPGGGLVLLADGSVKFYRDTIDPVAFEALSTIAGGELTPGTEITDRQPDTRREIAGFWPR